jgi:hypothetical protein
LTFNQLPIIVALVKITKNHKLLNQIIIMLHFHNLIKISN